MTWILCKKVVSAQSIDSTNDFCDTLYSMPTFILICACNCISIASDLAGKESEVDVKVGVKRRIPDFPVDYIPKRRSSRVSVGCSLEGSVAFPAVHCTHV